MRTLFVYPGKHGHLADMTRPAPLEICHKESTRALNAQQSAFMRAHSLIPLGRHIKHIDQEPYCRSVQFSCKERPERARRRRGGGQLDDDRPRTRLRDGVDGFLQVIIKEPTADDNYTYPREAAGHTNESSLFLDLFFLDSTRQSRDRSSRRHFTDGGKVSGSLKKLDQCLKINNSTLNTFDAPRKRLDGEFTGRVTQRRPMTIMIKDKTGGVGQAKKRPAMSQLTAAELGRGEGVTGVAIGPKKDPAPLGEVRLPLLGYRSGTYIGPVATPATPALSGVSSASSMRARAKRTSDVLWLAGTRPPNYLGLGSSSGSGSEEGSPSRTLDPKKHGPGTAKSEPTPSTTGVTPSPTGMEHRTKSSVTLLARPRYIQTDFGFNREALRDNRGMTLQKRVPRDSTALERTVGSIAEKHIYSCQTPSQHTRSSRTRQSVDGLRRTIFPVRGQGLDVGPVRGEGKRGTGLSPRGPGFGPRGKLMVSRPELSMLTSLPPIDGLNVRIYAQAREPTAAALG